MNALELVALVARRRRRSSGLDMDTLLPIIIGIVVVIVVVAVVVIIMKKKKSSGANPVNADFNNMYGGYDNMGAQNYAQPMNNQFESFQQPVAPVVTAQPVELAQPVEPAESVTPAAPVTPAAEPKTYVKLVNVQTGATYEAELGEQLTIGKRDCGITIPDDNSISGTHCQIYTYENNYVLADAQSTNGTKLNDYKIETPVFIENGGILGIGKQKFTVTFEKK